MPSEGVIQQLVLVHRPEQVPIEQGHVVGHVLGRQRLKVHVQRLRRKFLLRQRSLHPNSKKKKTILPQEHKQNSPITYQCVQVVLRRHKHPAAEAERRRDADVVVLVDGPLAVRLDLDQQQVLGHPRQLQLVGGARLDDLGRGRHREAQRAVRVVRAVHPEDDWNGKGEERESCFRVFRFEFYFGYSFFSVCFCFIKLCIILE